MEKIFSSANNATECHSARPVFLIHGRDRKGLRAVKKFLKTLSVPAISLHAQEGEPSVISRAQALAPPAFVVALMTPEDTVDYLKEAKTGRVQNEHAVAFDLAYFVYSGEAKNICVLHQGDVEKPFESQGVSYVPLEDAAWTSRVAETMQGAGLRIDAARAAAF